MLLLRLYSWVLGDADFARLNFAWGLWSFQIDVD